MLVLPPLIVSWTHNNSNQHQSDDGTLVTSTLNFLASTAATGAYVCHATLEIPDSDIIMINRSSVAKFSRGKIF